MSYDLNMSEDWGEESPLLLAENRYAIELLPIIELHPPGEYSKSFIHFHFKDHPELLAIDVPISITIIDCEKLGQEQLQEIVI